MASVRATLSSVALDIDAFAQVLEVSSTITLAALKTLPASDTLCGSSRGPAIDSVFSSSANRDNSTDHYRGYLHQYLSVKLVQCKSMSGNRYAQVYATPFHWVTVIPIPLKSDAHLTTLDKLFRKVGVPRVIWELKRAYRRTMRTWFITIRSPSYHKDINAHTQIQLSSYTLRRKKT
jgi:hypothetical protein